MEPTYEKFGGFMIPNYTYNSFPTKHEIKFANHGYSYSTEIPEKSKPKEWDSSDIMLLAMKDEKGNIL